MPARPCPPRRPISLILPGLVALSAFRPAVALAAPATPTRIDVVEGDPAYAVVAFDGGVALLSAHGAAYRIYRYKGLPEGPPDRVRIADVDGDGRAEVFGLGVPTFMLGKKGDPAWDVPAGCQGFALANVMGEAAEREFLCATGGVVTAYTHDAQEVWRFDYGKRTVILDLGAADLEEAGNDDVEFRVKNEKSGFWRISAQGEELGRDFPERATAVQDERTAYAAALAELLAGKVPFDLNGDGSAEETLKVDGGHVALLSAGKGGPLAEFDLPAAAPGGAGPIVTAAAVGDLDGDGKLEVVLGAAGLVRIVAHDGTTRADVRLDSATMRRAPDTRLNGANAMGLEVPRRPDNIEEADEQALKRLLEEKSFGAVSKCYEKALSAYVLTRRGKVILKFDVDKAGRVSAPETLYTDVTDDAVLSCISKAAKGWTVFPAVEDGAHMILDMHLGWVDSL